ncbi:nitroreductase family protein [Saccharospirillum impatiens]|uniref:nitroreductase family protein n=1 Tax=Saccharospirillum impatiens TaxID=169438 RepID=UPI0004225EFB|nr:nitroreductase [Saccharospirillum impatiens]
MTKPPESTVPAHPTLALLQQRVSHPRLNDPGPTQPQLAELYAAALRAPDHAWLRPWRFIEVSGDDRARLGEWMASSALSDDPEIPDKKRQKLLNSPMRAPLVLIAWAKITKHPKVPAIEQVLATGAAVTNLINAAHALGIGAVWRTGAPAYSPALKQALGMAEQDHLVGFIYLGTPAGEDKPIPDLNPADYVSQLPE